MTDTRTKLKQDVARTEIRMLRTRTLIGQARTSTEVNDLLRRYDDLDTKRTEFKRKLERANAAARGYLGAVGTIDVSGAGDASVARVRPVKPVFGGRP